MTDITASQAAAMPPPTSSLLAPDARVRRRYVGALA